MSTAREIASSVFDKKTVYELMLAHKIDHTFAWELYHLEYKDISRRKIERIIKRRLAER